jgi:hypothetical protein
MMCFIGISIMRLVAILAALAAAGFCITEPHQQRALEEPAFGIEFSEETIKISFASPNSAAKGLASIKGNSAYRDLMYSYFELCHWAANDQVPPQSYEDNNGTPASHATYVAGIEGIENLVWWRYEAHPNSTDVEILANAVMTVKRVATGMLADGYNITMPDRPLVALAAPNFMWTMTEPDFWDNVAAYGPPYDYGRDDWHHGFAMKMADAVREVGFRLEPVVDETDAATAPVHPDLTFPIAPASYAAFWNPEFAAGANSYPATYYTAQYDGPPAIVFELSNASLSLWAQQKDSVWSPWYTKPTLGTINKFLGDYPTYMTSADDWVWGDVVRMTRKLRSVMGCPEGELLYVYLTGDIWGAEMVDAFRSHLRILKCEKLDVVLRGEFAGSDGAAWAARGMLDKAGADL